MRCTLRRTFTRISRASRVISSHRANASKSSRRRIVFTKRSQWASLACHSLFVSTFSAQSKNADDTTRCVMRCTLRRTFTRISRASRAISCHLANAPNIVRWCIAMTNRSDSASFFAHALFSWTIPSQSKNADATTRCEILASARRTITRCCFSSSAAIAQAVNDAYIAR